MAKQHRREFLAATGSGLALGWGLGSGLFGNGPSNVAAARTLNQEPGHRPPQRPDGVTVENPRNRVPVSLIIDDSTCLVNLAHFAIPQFREIFPDQYLQPWKTLPREIPDAFVRKFAEWCHLHGVKGKYSVVPYPACVGWLDRELPGWSRRELNASLDLIRTLIVPDWDLHPEMISHTWVVDTRTGRPYPGRTSDFMENWGWSAGKSADELADYMSYALRILRNAGLSCTGITTPGGFGTRALPQLSRATLQACRDVFQAEIPHYFRHLFTDDQSVAPRVEYAAGLDGPDPECVVSIIGCTGDWFGGWDGLTPGSVDQFITADLKGGRLPDVIARGEPAIMVGHWPGFYFNGQEVGFKILQEIVERLRRAYDHLIWMKLSAIARYWAARELTRIEREGPLQLVLRAPFDCPGFTLKLDRPRLRQGEQAAGGSTVQVQHEAGGRTVPLKPVLRPLQLDAGAFHEQGQSLLVCFDLMRGENRLKLGANRS
jgi:hypothetical protein